MTVDALTSTWGDAEWFVLFVFAFYAGNGRDPATLHEHYRECAGFQVRVEELIRACQSLTASRVLRIRNRYGRPADVTYELIPHCLNRSTLLEVLKRSVAGDWWKIFGTDSNTGVPTPVSSERYPSGGSTLKYGHTGATLRRALVDATGLRVDFPSLYEPESEYWQAAMDLEDDLAADDVWTPASVPFSPSNPISLHLQFMSVLFVAGRDVRPMVRALGTAIAEDRLRLIECDLCELAAMAVLTGVRLDLSRALKWEMGDAAKDFISIADVLKADDLSTANKLCGAVFKNVREIDGVCAPAFNLLSILVNAFFKPSSTRLTQHARALCPNSSYRYYDHSSGERLVIDRRNAQLKRFADFVAGVRMKDAKIASWEFLNNLGEVVWLLANGLRREIVIAEAEAMLLTARKAEAVGYPTLAAAFLSAFGWAFSSERRAEATELAGRIAGEGGVWLRPFDAAPTEWKRVMSALEERLPKVPAFRAASAAKVRTGRIVWNLSFFESSKANLYCDRLAPSFRGPRAPEDGSGDRPVTLKSVYGGKYDDCLTEADKVAVAALSKAGYVGPRGQPVVPAAAVAALCGQDNVCEITGQLCVPISLVRQDVPIVGTPGANGSMRLSVPSWCIGLLRSYAIRKTDERAYAYYPFGRDVKSVVEVFRDYGDGGAIDFPKEALEPMRPVFGRLASLLPLQGALADIGGSSGMTRVTGDAMPLVRLALEEMRLHVSLKVRPVPSAPGVLFDPGAGQSERTLKLAKGPVILVRDLAREKASAATVEKALAAFEGDRDADWEWQIDEPASALEALAEIHALGKSAHVEWMPGRKVSVACPKARPNLEASLGADEWFSVSGEWQLDDGRLVSFARLLENFDGRIGRFVPIDEKGYLALSRALLRQLEALRAAGQVRKDAVAVSPAALPMLDGAFSVGDADGLQLPKAMSVAAERIREVFSKTPETPSAFKGTMRPYQEDGYRWLSRLSDCGIGACLADDMGLGKTIQLIALLAAKKAAGPSLVVAPASVAFNWRNEFARFAPSLKVALVGQTPGAQEEDIGKIAEANDVVVASYGVAASRLAAFAPVTWNILVLDEAQAIKNHLTQRAKSVKGLKARFRVAATGTPVENRLTELWSIFDFLNPGMLGGETRFSKELAPHGEATPQLKRLVKPLILRRIKRDVLTDLPEKEEITVPVVLGDEERHAYEATRISALAKLHGEDAQNKIAILAELTRLRRFCCHPSLVMPSVPFGAKLEALERLLAGLKENGHRALVFSQFVDFLAIVRKLLEKNGWSYEYLDGATSKADREKSVGRFQNGDGDFFLISLKAGGMGLNLTAANYVILLDPWWNPAVENQAADRAHRIGQRLPVTVYRLIAQDTIEEKVVNLHAKKTALAEDILASGASSLSAEAMLDLLKGDIPCPPTAKATTSSSYSTHTLQSVGRRESRSRWD